MGNVQVPEGSPLELGSANLYNLRGQYQKGPLAVRAEFFKAHLREQRGRRELVRRGVVPLLEEVAGGGAVRALEDPGPRGRHQHPRDAPTRSESFGLALNFWVSPEFVLKLNGYAVDGNMVAKPANAGLAAVLGTIDQKTGVLVLGAQFSF